MPFMEAFFNGRTSVLLFFLYSRYVVGCGRHRPWDGGLHSSQPMKPPSTGDTDVSAIGRVQFGKSSSYGSSQEETTARTNHRLTIHGLSAETNYYYQVVTEDALIRGRLQHGADPA